MVYSMSAKRRKNSGNWITRTLFQPRLLFTLAMICIVVVLGPHYSKFLPDISEQEEFKIPATSIKFTKPPEWVPETILEQVVTRGQLPEKISLLKKETTEEVASAFRLHPWIERVRKVRKKTGQIEVEVDYRRPVALVHLKDGYYPVDSKGILLPPGDFTFEDTKRYPVIEGIASVPQGAAGTPWGDKMVSSSASLATAIYPKWDEFHFKSVVIPKQDKPLENPNDIEFEIVTEKGSRILWGRGPQSGHPGELTVSQKIGRLEEYQHDHGSFDESRVNYIIDIRHWQSITRKPVMVSGKSKKNKRG